MLDPAPLGSLADLVEVRWRDGNYGLLPRNLFSLPAGTELEEVDPQEVCAFHCHEQNSPEVFIDPESNFQF